MTTSPAPRTRAMVSVAASTSERSGLLCLSTGVGVVTMYTFVQASAADVIAGCVHPLAELDSQGQSDVAEAHHCELHVFDPHWDSRAISARNHSIVASSPVSRSTGS